MKTSNVEILRVKLSFFVGLIEFYLLEPFGKFPNKNRIYNKPKTSKLWICPFRYTAIDDEMTEK